MKKISVIVPVYKVENYLRKCIESIIGQTYKNLEIILVDDGSPDNCPQICDEFAKNDNRIKVIHKSNGGLSDARNAGIEIATGDYIGFVDSDDYISINMYEKLLKACEENNCEIAICGFFCINNGKIIRKSNICDTKKAISKEYALQMLVEEASFGDYAWNKLYKRTLFDSNLNRYPVGRTMEDMATTYKLFDETKQIVLIEEPLYFYQVGRLGAITTQMSCVTWFDRFIAQVERESLLGEKHPLLRNEILSKIVSTGKEFLIRSFKQKKTYKKEIKLILQHYKQNKIEIQTNELIGKSIKLFYRLYEINACLGILGNKLIRLASKLKKKTKRSKKIDVEVADSKNIFSWGVPEHNNLGDHAIAYAQKSFLKENFADYNFIIIPELKSDNFIDSIKRQISKNDIIAMHGGGNIGNQYQEIENERRKVIKTFKQNQIIIFPQTVYFTKDKNGARQLELSKKIYSKHKNLTICAREEVSYKILKKYFCKNKVLFCPDIVLSLNFAVQENKREGALLCLRSDVEGKLDANNFEQIKKSVLKVYKTIDITDTCYYKSVGFKENEEIILKKLQQISKYKVVITDRLHGMIFCAITGTPCIVLGNYNHKVKEAYKLLSELKYIKFIDSIDKLNEAITVVKVPNKEEIYSARKFNDYYEALKQRFLVE